MRSATDLHRTLKLARRRQSRGRGKRAVAEKNESEWRAESAVVGDVLSSNRS